MKRLEIENNRVIHLWDERYAKPTDITDGSGRFGNLVYTLLSEDIKTMDKPEFVAYNDHYAGYEAILQSENKLELTNQELETRLEICEEEDEIILDFSCQSRKVSSCGLFFPLNFMSCKNGTYESQFLVSSPYHTVDKKHWMHYFTRPDGNNLVLIVEGELDGYKIHYSPFLSGHFIRGFSFLSRFDRAYGLCHREECRMKVHMVPVQSYEEALKRATEIWQLPALYYELSSVRIGEHPEYQIYGDADEIRLISPSGEETIVSESGVSPKEYGIYTLIPYKDGKAGMDISFFAWDSKEGLYRRAMDSLSTYHDDVLGKNRDGEDVWRPTHLFYRGYYDHNLCEHGMWCWALLRTMRDYGLQEDYVREVKNHLSIVMEGESNVQLNCCTISKEQGYRTRNSTRIQEVYGGVNILLDAYRVFGEETYLNYALQVLDARILADINADGAIMRHGSDGVTAENADYTTVTCMVFPIVDMAVTLKGLGDERYQFYEEAAIRVANHVVNRGFSFPTEGGEHPEVQEEVEEGSISCSALTVLYVAWHLCDERRELRQRYVKFAGEILKLHDAYTVFTPHPVLFRSSLRWWETIWEGDSDGPAVCFGHAWSLWRAEAQFLYGLLCYDNDRLVDSYNGFMGNYAKEDADGNLYAIYQYEPISGGDVRTHGSEMEYEVHDGFPKRKDDTTAYYLFARDFECWKHCAAVLDYKGKTIALGCKIVDNEIIFEDETPEILYIGTEKGPYRFCAERMPRIICAQDKLTKTPIFDIQVTNAKKTEER